ncbi:CHAD domain-containing protein [Hydrogenimonas sp.]
MKHFEIERRFLLYPCSMKRFLKMHGIPFESSRILQFYLVANEGEVVRYRRRDDTYVRTVKRGSGLVREESEEPITKEAFEEAFRRNRGGVIEKRRLLFRMDGYTFELDSFKKRLKGLNILEVEFASESEARKFELPRIFETILAAEVTRNAAFTNGALSRSMRIPPLETPLEDLLAQVERRERHFKASVDIAFGPFESGAHALKALLFSLLKTAEANKTAILQGDTDPERLHQLRVAMRKMRALFSQMGGLFDPLWRLEHKERVASLMRMTGPMRDIDVYLEEMHRYRKMLPKRLHPGLAKLERYLLQQQSKESGKLTRLLSEGPFDREFETLMRFARSESGEGLCEEAFSPVILPVKTALRKRYARILKKGRKIDDSSPAHDYHMVRIEVKKLRYLMEFFSSIFDRNAYEEMVGRLKSIQTILGKHQDLDVQREHLKSFADLSQMHDDTTLEALKLLRERMGRLEIEKRAEFRRAFLDFIRTEPLFNRMICKF